VPNQHQFIQIYADGITRWMRCFDPRQKKWIGDTRGSDDGNDWFTVDKVQFEHVSGTFPGDTDPGEPSSNLHENRVEYVPDVKRERHDDFLARVAEVCECRWPGAKVTPIRSAQPHLDYLRVVVTQAPFVRQYPVGAFENGITRADLDRFITLIDAKYRISDSGLTSEIVYGGSNPVTEDIVREAERRRVLLLSFVEYQGIIDFRGYIKCQTDKLEKDTIYPPALYVPQRMKFAVGRDEGETNDALGTTAEWLASPNARFVLILGDFGTGKTFLLHELARQMAADSVPLTPILIEMRALEKGRTFDQLVAQHLASAGEQRIDLKAFQYMLAQGRIALLFDGFDELALRVTFESATEHFGTLVEAADGNAKVVVTSRTQHFESDRQIKTALGERADQLPGLRIARLQYFDEAQILNFLVKRMGNKEAATARLELLRDVKDLFGLSANPRMLSFIAELEEERLLEAKQRTGSITAAELYRMLIDRWLGHEFERIHPRGASVFLPLDQRLHAVTNLT
jgi:hypothetical protein